jgi:hypothetical protein
MRLRWFAPLGVIVVPVVVAVAFLSSMPPPSSSEGTFSFEQDMEGWVAGGRDLYWGNCSAGVAAVRPTTVSAGNCTTAWSVEQSTELAKDGGASVKLFLDNLNDAGKIWMMRAFNVTPDRTYRVHVAFAFASADYGSVNHWRIIAGALAGNPTFADSLPSLYRDDTGNGLSSPGGYVWLDKAYDSTVWSDADGHVMVVVGVWGTWEGPRAYYVDSVQVTIQPT